MKQDIETTIWDQLMIDIHNGKYDLEGKLPSENELADAYSVSRILIRNVYRRLEEMGYIYAKQGKGRYVKNRYELIELFLTGNESFSKKMKDGGYDFISINVYCEKIDFNSKIYSELGVCQEDEIYKIGRLRIINKRPIALHTSYVAKSVFKDIDKAGGDIISMFDYYKEKGYETFMSEKTLLSISFPTSQEREILSCPELVPLLLVETNCIDSVHDRVLEYTKIIYRGDSFKYVVK